MNYFTFKPPYREKGRTILEVNVLPDKYCPFNCIYCPVDRKKFQHIRTEEVHFFRDWKNPCRHWKRHCSGPARIWCFSMPGEKQS